MPAIAKTVRKYVFIVFSMVWVDRILRSRRLRNRTAQAKMNTKQGNNIAGACDISIYVQIYLNYWLNSLTQPINPSTGIGLIFELNE